MINLYILKITDMPDPRDHEEWRSLFPDGKHESILRFMGAGDRKRSAGAWLLLKYALKNRGLSDRLDTVTFGEKGKPMRDDICFSLAHSGDYAICVLSDFAVGADVERLRDYNEKVARNHFSEAEYKRMEQEADSVEKRKMFVKAWCFRESYMKKTGEGLSFGLNRIVPGTDRDGRYRALIDGEPDLNSYYFESFLDGHQFTICSEEDNRDMKLDCVGAMYLRKQMELG